MTPRPPLIAEWLVTHTLPRGGRERETLPGDLAEEFHEILATNGPGAARRWYRRQVLRSILPNLGRRLQRSRAPREPHDRRGTMESLAQDLRYGWRMLARRPAVATIAVASLGLGMALPAVVFSLLNAVLLRPLPVADPDGLAVLLEVRKTGLAHNFSYPDFEDYRNAQRVFDGMFAYARQDVAIRGGTGTEVVAAELVSGGYFDILDVRMRVGRGLEASDDVPGAAPAAVVSESLWRETSGDLRSFTSRTITVNDHAFTIVGVAAEPFRGMEVGRDVKLWLPVPASPLLDARRGVAMTERRMSWLSVIGRLRDGISREQGARELTAMEAALAPAAGRPQARTLTLAPGRQGDSMLPATAGGPLTLLFGAALLVLLVACANVSNLLLVRATERSREIAVRSALGASRARLARLVLVEALLVAVIGAAMAVVAARWLAGVAAPLITSFGEPVTLDLALDWRTLAFVAATGAFATLAAGMAPLLRVLGRSAGATVDGARGASTTRRASRAHQLILTVQFALSLALVTTAVLLARTVHNLSSLDTGLDMAHVALLGADPSAARYDARRSAAFFADAIEALERYPGVVAAGFGRVIPLGFGGSRTTVAVPGYEPGPDEDMELNVNTVSPSYFESLGIRMKEGRPFDERDTASRPRVAIVNETMAGRYWRGRSAVGQHLQIGDGAVEIVGVAPDVKYRTLREQSRPSFYLPLAQDGAGRGVLHVRTSGDPRALLPGLQRTVAALDPRVPVTAARTLQDQARLNMNDERIAMLIGLALGLAALALSTVGLYASMAYLVGQRAKELGVRVALGATARHLRDAVLGQGLRIAVGGTLLGAGGAFLLARALESRFFGVTAGDPATFGLGAAVLAAAALAACWAPARRAAGVDPLHALREE